MSETIHPEIPFAACAPNQIQKTRHGVMLYNPNDLYIGKSLAHYGEFSEGEITLFRGLIPQGALILDIGAHIGTHSLFLAHAIGPSGVLMAFEPQRILFQMLCANMALNGIQNAFCYNAAVGASAGALTVPIIDYAIENNFAGLSLSPEFQGHGEQTGLLPVDSLALPKCHFMKIDVEGMETEVLKGASATLTRCRPLIYVENDRREKSPELIERIRSMGYRLFWHCPPLFNPDNFYGNQTNWFKDIISINMLGIPTELTLKIDGLREVSGADDWYV